MEKLFNYLEPIAFISKSLKQICSHKMNNNFIPYKWQNAEKRVYFTVFLQLI